MAWFLVHVRQGNNVHCNVRVEVEAPTSTAARRKALLLADDIHDPVTNALRISERPFNGEEAS